MNIVLPIDLLTLPQFRQLRDHFTPPNAGAATFVWVALCSELAQQMQAGVNPGLLPADALDSFQETLGPVLTVPRAEHFQSLMARLVEIKLLTRDGQNYFCPRFVLLNSNVGGFRERSARGGDTKAYNGRQARIEHDVVQLGLLLNPQKLRDAAGQPLDDVQSKRVLMLIKACDNALFMPDRQAIAITEAMILNGLMVLAAFTDEEINAVCFRIHRQRGHPLLLGLTTERLLPDFKNFIEKLA